MSVETNVDINKIESIVLRDENGDDVAYISDKEVVLADGYTLKIKYVDFDDVKRNKKMK